MTTLDAFLKSLDARPHDDRMRRAVDLGRRAREDASAAALLDALRAHATSHARYLALAACHGSRDGAHAVAALGDASGRVRGLATVLVASVCSDDQLRAALHAAGPDALRPLLRRLRRRGRRAPVDAFLDDLAAAGDPRLPDLLPYGTTDAVRRHLAAALPRAHDVFWRRLARGHASLAAATLGHALDAAGETDARAAQAASAALPRLAARAPDDALALLARHGQRLAPDAWHAATTLVACRRPDAVARLALAHATAPVALPASALRRLSPAVRAEVVRDAAVALPPLGPWFARLPPGERASVLARYRDAHGAVDAAGAARLPRAEREAEATRAYDQPRLATRPAQRLPYAALLGWDEAWARFRPVVEHPDPDRRALAWALLPRAADFGDDGLAALLAALHARRNECDPVRRAFLTGLARVRPGRWRAEHLDAAGALVRDALDAADLSDASVAPLERLLMTLLPRFPEWACGWIDTLVRERGRWLGRAYVDPDYGYTDDAYDDRPTPGYDDRVSDDDVRRALPHLARAIRAWRDDRAEALVAFALDLGRRLRVFDALADALAAHWAAQVYYFPAADALARWQPRVFARAVEKLLPKNPALLAARAVGRWVLRRRQDLLRADLRPLAQAFPGGAAAVVTGFPVRDGRRLTPAQQNRYGALVATALGDKKRDTPSLVAAARLLPGLPDLAVGVWAPFAAEKRVALRDTVLRMLGRADAAQGVETLLGCMGDDRARVAIYALRRALRVMSRARALDLLSRVPMGKVTVAKEVVRLSGALGGADALSLLRRWDGTKLHRDVRVALLRALWDHLDVAETWEVLERHAADPDPAFVSALVPIPAATLAPDARARLAALLARIAARPEPEVRLEVLTRVGSLPVEDPGGAFLAPVLAALGSPVPDERDAAAAAALACVRRDQLPAFAQRVRALLADRRATSGLVAALRGALPTAVPRVALLVDAVLDALAEDRAYDPLRADLELASAAPERVGALVASLAASRRLSVDVLSRAAAALAFAPVRGRRAEWTKLEGVLGSHDDARVRRLGLALLVGLSQPPHGWAKTRLARLARYRADADPDVAGAAALVLPEAEVAPARAPRVVGAA